MHIAQTVAWLAFRTPIFDHPDRVETYESARDAFLAQLEPAFAGLSETVTLNTVEIKEPPAEVLRWMGERHFMVSTKLCEYVCIVAETTVDTDQLAQVNSTSVANLDAELIAACAAIDLAQLMESLLVLSELSYPGCIDALTGLAVADQIASYPIQAKGTYHELWFPDADDPQWPVVEQVPLVVVGGWAKRVGMFESGLATTRLQRTLAAFTHVVGLTWQRDGEVLFRAMQGLEAFYCDGVGDLRRQLSDKAQVWLGRWSDKKNVVGQLYDLRSKFVHGSAKLEYWNHHRDSWAADERAMKEFVHGKSFAVRLLVATLQSCCVRDVLEVEWSYAVEARSSA